jgi:hypothetical protein
MKTVLAVFYRRNRQRYNALQEEIERMSTAEILKELDAEIARLTQARSLLAGAEGGMSGGSRRASLTPHKKRVMSAEARARIAAAQRKRWAKQKAGK